MENKQQDSSDIKDKILQEREDRRIAKQRSKNKLNSLLNNNFHYVSFLVLALILFFSFKYIIVPKYNRVIIASREAVEERKKEFTSKYKDLITYRENVASFEQIDPENIDKVEKMIVSRRNRDDIFAEFVYFLMKHNFNVKSLKISDSLDLGSAPRDVSSVRPEGSRRALDPGDLERGPEESAQRDVSNKISLLPPNIGAWILSFELGAVSYTDLKYLLDVVENNLNLIDIVHLDFDPQRNTAKVEALNYYYKN